MSGAPQEPFPATRVDEIPGDGNCGFLVATMYTPSYADRAARLRASCEALKLPLVSAEIPTIHNSISVKGSPDLRYTKPNFIRSLLQRHRRPILYVDADCVFRSHPVLVDELVAGGTDFGIYNWAADPDNEAFVPINIRSGGEIVRSRYFDLSHRVHWYSVSQAVLSGCVQLYADSDAAETLLQLWQGAIQRFPGSADDACLMHVLNNRDPRLDALSTYWLPKEYARYAWWIYVKPVIDHPEVPSLVNTGFAPIPEGPDGRYFYPERCEITPAKFPFPCILDVQDKVLHEVVDGELLPAGAVDMDFWIAPELEATLTVDLEIP